MTFLFTPQEWARRARALHPRTIASDVEIDRRCTALADAWRLAEAAHFAEHAAMIAYTAMMPSRDVSARDAAHESWGAALAHAAATLAHATQFESALGSDLRCELLATGEVVYGRPHTSRASTPRGRARAMIVLWRRPTGAV